MPVEILMPELGESVHEATITRWIVKEGDFVKEDDPVVEIMTDKVNTELPSPASGTLSKILVEEGGSVRVFEPMGLIEEGEPDRAKTKAKPESAAKEPAAKEEGPKSKPEQQAVAAVRAPSDEPEAPSADGKRRWFTPVVRAIARREGIAESELASLSGTGAGGRLTKKDLEAYIASGKKSKAPGPMELKEKPAPKIAGPEQETLPLGPLRKMIAEAMMRSAEVPTVSTSVQVDVSELVRFREANKEAFQSQHGVKLTYTPFFIKALTEALLEFPTVNASLQGDQVLVNRAVHMGVAVALGKKGDEGLIVPVIRDCHKKTLVDLARDLEEIAAKARTNALEPADVQGGTFTLSNPGSYGALIGTPMIVAPQAGIAGAYAIQKSPVVVGDDMIAIRSVMYLVLTYDHRIIDGLLAGRFLQAVKKRLEEFDFFA